MEVYKWNFKRYEYEKSTLPNNKGYHTNSVRHRGTTHCIYCDKPIVFKECCVSRAYKDLLNNGFCICKECREKEDKQWEVNIWEDD